jgi:hypothetical protein
LAEDVSGLPDVTPEDPDQVVASVEGAEAFVEEERSHSKKLLVVKVVLREILF